MVLTQTTFNENQIHLKPMTPCTFLESGCYGKLAVSYLKLKRSLQTCIHTWICLSISNIVTCCTHIHSQVGLVEFADHQLGIGVVQSQGVHLVACINVGTIECPHIKHQEEGSPKWYSYDRTATAHYLVVVGYRYSLWCSVAQRWCDIPPCYI